MSRSRGSASGMGAQFTFTSLTHPGRIKPRNSTIGVEPPGRIPVPRLSCLFSADRLIFVSRCDKGDRFLVVRLTRYAKNTHARTTAVVFVELAQGDPQELGGFFWISSIASARCKRRFRRAFSRSSCLTLGSSGFALGPRFFLARPSLATWSICRRQVVRFEEYRPSCLRIAPTSPGALH